MGRPRLSAAAVFAPALLVALAFTVACSPPPEQAQLRQFFRASQLRDNSTLANLSATEFDPRTAGVVTSFDIVSVSEERRTPLNLMELAKAHEAARAADEALSKRMKAYQDENLPAIERVLKAESAQGQVAARDRAVQDAWRKWREEVATSAKAVSDARSALNARRPLVELSIQRVGAPVDVSSVEGEMVSKDVTLDAQVRPPDSEDAMPKQIVVTMERAVLNVPGEAEPRTGRWIITKVAG